MLPICFTHGLALLSQYYKSSTCVCSVIFSLQRRCMGVLCCHFRPKMFSPGDHVRYHSRTCGAHVLATVVGPSPNGTQFCHIRYIRPGGVTPVDHESAQVSRLEAVAVESPKCVTKCRSTKVASHVFSLLASVEGTTVCLEIPLQCPPPPPGHRHLVTVSPPHPGDRRALPRDFARGAGGMRATPAANPPIHSSALWLAGTGPVPDPATWLKLLSVTLCPCVVLCG